MRIYSLIIPANEAFELAASGDYVRVKSSAVELTIENQASGEKIEVGQGDDFQFTQFKNLRITHKSAGNEPVKLIVSTGKKAGSSQIAGALTLSGLGNGAFTQGRASLSNVNQQLLAANSARKYLLIQNNDASAVMRVTLSGAAATAAQGFRVQPGESLELSTYNVTGAVNAIMETATAAAGNVEFAEG